MRVMKQLKNDLDEIGRLHKVSGRVVSEWSEEKPIVLILWSVDNDDASFNNYWVIPSDGQFSFGSPDGRYYLLAFEDANEDGHYQADVECVGIYGDSAVLDLGSNRNYEHLLLTLSPPGESSIPAAIRAAVIVTLRVTNSRPRRGLS